MNGERENVEPLCEVCNDTGRVTNRMDGDWEPNWRCPKCSTPENVGGTEVRPRCDEHIRVFYGDLFCDLPRGHEGNHKGTSRYDSRDVWWTPTAESPT